MTGKEVLTEKRSGKAFEQVIETFCGNCMSLSKARKILINDNVLCMKSMLVIRSPVACFENQCSRLKNDRDEVARAGVLMLSVHRMRAQRKLQSCFLSVCT